MDGKGWLPAGGLAIGNAIVTRAGPRLTVKSIKWNRRIEGYRVYNFQVEALSGKEADGKNTHSYFVGNVAGGAWVHNATYKARFFDAGDVTWADQVKLSKSEAADIMANGGNIISSSEDEAKKIAEMASPSRMRPIGPEVDTYAGGRVSRYHINPREVPDPNTGEMIKNGGHSFFKEPWWNPMKKRR